MNPRAQRAGGLGFALALWWSAHAFAITQPTTGATIPIITGGGSVCSDKNVQLCLNDAEGNATNINALTDAKVTPEIYQPTCNLTFVPIVKGGSIVDAFGWYNVVPDPANAGKFLQPTVAQMYGMYTASGFQTGAQLAGQSFVLDLKTEATAGRYTGGAIGFFLVSGTGNITIDPTTHQLKGDGGTLLTPQYQFFTQQAFNAKNPGSTAGALYYNVLTWQSVRDPNTFYFGWEDLPIPQGSDSDFDDFVFAVTGVQCGGGGEACDTGKLGPCKAGTMQCRKGVLTCIQTVAPTTETCNAVDDDCSGQVDDGTLCPTDQICSHGVCVSNCSSGEFPCLPGFACNSRGECVEPACAAIDCAEGLACKGGNCVDACTGITCPHGLSCLNGGCVDPCQGVQCDSGFTCVLGVCESCACSDCATGQVCNKQNLCVDTGCDTQTCAAGSYCAQGQCHDNCEGAVCPPGQICMSGGCIADPNQVPDAGVGGTGGQPVLSFGGQTSTGGTVSVGGSDGGASLGGSGTRRPAAGAPAAGCGCGMPGSGKPGSVGPLLLLLLGLSLRRRATAGSAAART